MSAWITTMPLSAGAAAFEALVDGTRAHEGGARAVKLVSFDGGFGRVEGEAVVPMGDDLVEYLRTGRAADGEPIAARRASTCARRSRGRRR